MHPNEIDNRMKKAQRFLAYIDSAMPEATAAMLALVGESRWESLARDMGENPPSDATISTIIALVRGREMAVESIRAGIARESGVRS